MWQTPGPFMIRAVPLVGEGAAVEASYGFAKELPTVFVVDGQWEMAELPKE